MSLPLNCLSMSFACFSSGSLVCSPSVKATYIAQNSVLCDMTLVNVSFDFAFVIKDF